MLVSLFYDPSCSCLYAGEGLLYCHTAHLHHAWDSFNRYGRTKRALKVALISTREFSLLLRLPLLYTRLLALEYQQCSRLALHESRRSTACLSIRFRCPFLPLSSKPIFASVQTVSRPRLRHDCDFCGGRVTSDDQPPARQLALPSLFASLHASN